MFPRTFTFGGIRRLDTWDHVSDGSLRVRRELEFFLHLLEPMRLVFGQFPRVDNESRHDRPAGAFRGEGAFPAGIA